MLNEDYKEMLQILLNNKVKFLIVGAYAMGAQGYPRATGDFDIWVESSSENSKKIYNSLVKFGAPLKQINPETFTEKGVIFQLRHRKEIYRVGGSKMVSLHLKILEKNGKKEFAPNFCRKSIV